MFGPDDPFFGTHMQSMQRMNQMMNSMFDPFGMMGAPAIMDVQQQNNGMQQMMPFGAFPMMPAMPSIGHMFSNMQNMTNNPNCHSFSSSSVMTMTSGSDGRPQIYQESMSTRVAPGGVKETKKTVSNSRTGLKKMAIGHHIGDRAHVLEREQNYISGDQEERQEFINLDEEEADSFNQEWEQRTNRTMGAIAPPNYRSPNYYNHGNQMLALPSTHSSSPSQQFRNEATNECAPIEPRRPAQLSQKPKKKPSSRPIETSTSSNQQQQQATSSNRKLHRNKDMQTNKTKHYANNTDENETIDLTKSPESSNSSGRKRTISPEIEEVAEPNNKKRMAAKSNE